MSCEVTVIIKDEEKTLRKKFLVYEPITVNENDPIIKDCIEETLQNFDGDPDHIEVKINLQIS
jgi:hypothetical protein